MTKEFKLIGMTEFVLKQYELFKNDGAPQRINLIGNYANFLNQTLNLGMFIPCDEYGNVLKEVQLDLDGSNEIYYKEWLKAKEKVLFEGFSIVSDKYKSIVRHFVWLDDIKQIYRELHYPNGNIKKFFINYYDDFQKVEDLVKYKPTLTQSAINQLQLT